MGLACQLNQWDARLKIRAAFPPSITMGEELLLDTKDNKGYHLQVSYHKGSFEVKVTAPDDKRKLEKKLEANYEPRWGIDVLDQEAIYRAATKLAKKLEKQGQA